MNENRENKMEEALLRGLFKWSQEDTEEVGVYASPVSNSRNCFWIPLKAKASAAFRMDINGLFFT